MFVRFTVNEVDEDSRQPLGILHAVRYLRDDNALTKPELARADRVFNWLYSHLKAPSKKTLQKSPTAVSWFRIEAQEHIKRMEQLVPIVEAHGYVAKRKTSLNPGEIVYSDAVQVFAVRRPNTKPSGSRQRRGSAFCPYRTPTARRA